MLSKLSWIAFIPFTVAAVAIRLVQLFYISGENPTFFGLDSLMLSYVAIGCVLAIFILAVIFCLVDKKIAPIYKIKKNFPAGILGLLFGIALACDGASKAFESFSTSSFGVLSVMDIAFTILAAVVFVVFGLNHFIGNGGVKGLAIFYLIPTLWGVVRLINCFLTFTTVSIAITDVSKLVCYIFITLFLFNYAMIVSLLHGKSPVKSALIYGFAAASMLTSYGVYTLGSVLVSEKSADFFANVSASEFLILGLYILSFIVELSLNVKKKDDVEIISSTRIDDDVSSAEAVCADPEFENTVSSDDVMAANRISPDDDSLIITEEVTQGETDEDVDTQYLEDVDIDDYIYNQNDIEDDIELVVPADLADKVSVDSYLTKEDDGYEQENPIKKTVSQNSRMDEIDKLILQISEDEFKE